MQPNKVCQSNFEPEIGDASHQVILLFHCQSGLYQLFLSWQNNSFFLYQLIQVFFTNSFNSFILLLPTHSTHSRNELILPTQNELIQPCCQYSSSHVELEGLNSCKWREISVYAELEVYFIIRENLRTWDVLWFSARAKVTNFK